MVLITFDSDVILNSKLKFYFGLITCKDNHYSKTAIASYEVNGDINPTMTIALRSFRTWLTSALDPFCV